LAERHLRVRHVARAQGASQETFPGETSSTQAKLAARGVLHHSKLVKFLYFTLLFNFFYDVFLLSTIKFSKKGLVK
jgi:hypothetical protein